MNTVRFIIRNAFRHKLRTALIGPGPTTLETFFNFSSNNKFDYVPSVIDWTKLNITPKGCHGEQHYNAEAAAAIELQHPEVHLSDYQHIVFVGLTTPPVEPPPGQDPDPDTRCYAGETTEPGNRTWRWMPPASATSSARPTGSSASSAAERSSNT